MSTGDCDVELALGTGYDDGYLYWNWECDSSNGGPARGLVRAKASRPRCASEVRAWAAPNDDPDMAADAGRVFYGDARGLFALPDRPRWPTPRCAR